MQLVKHNSIEGNKLSNVKIVYTLWNNLKKTGDMDVGQVGFHNHREIRRSAVEKRCNATINRLNRTKREANPDLAKEKTERQKELGRIARENARKQAAQDMALRAQQQAEKEARSYDRMYKPENMLSNKDLREDVESFEDDFM